MVPLDVVPNNLPVQLTSFIGREPECATVAGLVTANRLVTIAERLFVSRSTVKMHLTHIFAKLAVPTRAEVAAAATRRAL